MKTDLVNGFNQCRNFVVFFRLLDRIFNEDSKNVRKTVIFSFLVDLTSNFVSNYKTVKKLQKSEFGKVLVRVKKPVSEIYDSGHVISVPNVKIVNLEFAIITV